MSEMYDEPPYDEVEDDGDCDGDCCGCCFPDRCLMPGEHLRSECHTAEMLENYLAEQGADQREALRPRNETN